MSHQLCTKAVLEEKIKKSLEGPSKTPHKDKLSGLSLILVQVSEFIPTDVNLLEFLVLSKATRESNKKDILGRYFSSRKRVVLTISEYKRYFLLLTPDRYKVVNF